MDLGLDRLDLRAIGRVKGLLARRGVVVAEIRLDKGFQPNMRLGKENFRFNLHDLQTQNWTG